MLKSLRFPTWNLTSEHLYYHLSLGRRRLLTLAIESSCDDTSVAVLEKNDHPSQPGGNGVASLHFHEHITADNSDKKGIDPIRALDSHARSLALLVNKSLHALPTASIASTKHIVRSISLKNGTLKRVPDFITVTRGPGMRSNLSTGLNTAKGLAVAWQIPLLAVHHMQAHALTPRLVHALSPQSTSSSIQPQFPFLSLLISGGHTVLIHSKGLIEHKTLATSQDIAIGEALDKIGRLLLPNTIQAEIKDIAYAKHLSTYAFPTPTSYADYQPPSTRGAECIRTSNEYGWHIPTPYADTRHLRFSFSGIASEVHRLFHLRTNTSHPEQPLATAELLAFARSALTVAFNHLASRTILALEKLRKEEHLQRSAPIRTLVVSGGVAANSYLRHVLRRFLDVRGYGHVELCFPPVELCTDNAAMIAWCGMEMWEEGWRSELSVRAVRRWSMDSEEVDADRDGDKGEERETEGKGGILGVEGWYNVKQDRIERMDVGSN
ncbi:hypothetical protein GJ744_005701 [Endocarpon pusillum]|uniref:Gcp-like domain-containing protein n=1 Tax=Endocarpon pusillum TaxID=364733 RepID=A0A8H7APK0_9EURO|nr:hypothetical protein GJ744_005701 [Endocarpon pusillum]